MTESDKVKMTIRIGGEFIDLDLDFNRQEAARNAENEVAKLFDAWRLKYPARTDTKILAMVAYQFASHYLDLYHKVETAVAAATAIDRKIANIIDENSDIVHDL